MSNITEEMESAILRYKNRAQKAVVTKLRESPAQDTKLIHDASVLLLEQNIQLAEAGLRLAAENQRLREIVEDRAAQDALSMELGKPRE